MSRWFKKSINYSVVWLTGIPLASCFKGQAMFPFIASGRLENSNSKLKRSTVQQKDNGGKNWKSFFDKMSIFEGAMNNCLFARFLSQLSWTACWCRTNCPMAGRCGEEGTEERCRNTPVTGHVPAPAGMSKCKHGDCLTDLFYYERKIWDSSSLITVLTSDNFTPLLFNGNITHAILKMEKHFPVLFKSEMIYETERLGGVRWCWEQLMKFRFKRIWDKAQDASKTVSKKARTWEVIKARADGTDLRF